MFNADVQRIEKEIRELNRFNSTPEYGTTRVLFTEPEVRGREYIVQLMKDAGLDVSFDGAGNIFGTLAGSEKNLAPVWTGSHCDTVLNAGMFDGMAGVIGGIEALRLIKESGAPHRRSITVVMFTSEEPTRFGLSCLGSRALAGRLDEEGTKKLSDENNVTLWEELDRLGYLKYGFDKVKKKPGDVFACVEMHIEQSSSLEKCGRTIGIVKTICAPANYEIEITGTQSHAGGTPMDSRSDAFCACCELSLEAEKLAKESSGEYVTATVGRVTVVPGAVNVIPGYVRMSLDVRYTDTESLNRLMDGIKAKISQVEKERGVSVKITELNSDTPAQCNEKIMECIRNACEGYGYSEKTCISGAYHDSLMVSDFAPVSMIFVPSRGGISHSPEEWTDFEDIAKGANVLAQTLLEVSDIDSLQDGN